MTILTTESTSKNTANIIEDFILGEETNTTRKVFRASIIDNPNDPNSNVRGLIIHQRKNPSGLWEDTKSINLTTLKGGEGVKFELRSSQVKDLYNAIDKSRRIANGGIEIGKKEFIILDNEQIEEIVSIPDNQKELIKELIKQNLSEEIWMELIDQEPDIASKLAFSRIQSNRIKVLNQFQEGLNKNHDENYWQKFFEENTWIFGYGLNYQFLNLLQSQPHLGGTQVNRKGAQKGDYLMNTSAKTKFTVLVEIKKDNTELLDLTKRYRNGAYQVNSEVVGGVSQLQVNCKTWEIEGSNQIANFEEFSKSSIFTHQPKGILVVGNTNQLDSYEKRNSFELFRQNLSNPEIITFDELYERAKYIVGEINNQENF